MKSNTLGEITKGLNTSSTYLKAIKKRVEQVIDTGHTCIHFESFDEEETKTLIKIAEWIQIVAKEYGDKQIVAKEYDDKEHVKVKGKQVVVPDDDHDYPF